MRAYGLRLACGLRLAAAFHSTRPPAAQGLLAPAANRWWRGASADMAARAATGALQLCASSSVLTAVCLTPAQLPPPIQAGVDIFRVFDSLNDIDQLRFGIGESLTKAAAARGLKGHSRKARAACRGWLLHTWA